MDNWLINLLALVLFVVVLDGARRAYLKHRDTMKVSRNLSRAMRRDMDEREYDDIGGEILSTPRKVESEPAPERKPAKSNLVNSDLEYIDPEEAERRRQVAAELPGTVRVVQRRKPEDASQVNRQVQQNFHSSRKPLAGSKPDRSAVPDFEPAAESRVPEQASLNLEEQVPTLMDSVFDEPESARDAFASQPQESSSPDQLAALARDGDEPEPRREPSLDESVSLESLQSLGPEEELPQEESLQEKPAPQKKSGWAAADLKFPEFKKASPFGRRSADDEGAAADSGNKAKAGAQKSAARKERDVEEVLILNIMAPPGDCFEGNDLLRVLLSSGLRFGDMNIFHYHCGEAGEGPVLFSLANIVVPGTFDMSQMEDFTTPGVSMFLALPAEVEALKALDTLLGTARYIAEQLGGELKDENRSVFTGQTAEHYRQRVMEFQRRKALAKAQA